MRAIVLFIALVATTVSAQSNLPACIGGDVSRWSRCYGTATYPSGNKYVGEYRDGKAHGQGTYTYANGDKYVGEFTDGKAHGQGTYFSLADNQRKGDKYVGELRDGKRHGQGTYTLANGDKYVGEFRDDKRHGQGTYTFANGNKYVGEYRDGKRHGQGTYTLANGDKYVGEFRDGKAHGQGTYFSLADNQWKGDKYVGEYMDGKAHGQGTYTLANGDKYVGEFRDDKRHGQGTYTFANGNKYVGEIRDDKYNGQGIFTFADGRPPQEGIWGNNNFVRAQRIPDHIAGRTTSTPPTVAAAPRQAEPPRSTLALSLSTSQPNAEGVVTITITTNSDTASLMINGDEAGGRADGRYSIKRFAQIGSNSFEVIATDRFGNTSKQTVVVNREIQVVAERTRSLNPTLINSARPRDAVAIIIGIEKYRRVPDADFANRDASAFYDYARRALGIKPENIRLLVDDKADAAEILRAFKTWLPTRVNKNTTDVYVFYSGHGLPSEDGGSLYFLPHEVDRDLLERTAITQKEVVQAIQRTAPKSVMMFIDSCYSGQSRTGTSLLASARPISIAPKVSTDFPPNFMVISASAPDQISSSSPELKHGIFSYYLMLGMEGEADVNKDGQITVGEMQTYLSQQVTRRAIGMNRTQSPQTTGDLNRVLVHVDGKIR